ncbi:MAG: regulatory protein RecX, partial [Bacteroidota bacterium]
MYLTHTLLILLLENIKKKYLDKSAALSKLQRYCAYQERCHSEVRSKLLELGVYGDTLEEVIADLITDNYLNEERFATQYTLGKFNIKRWGKIKIKQELKSRHVSDYSIRQAFAQLHEDEYEATLLHILRKKD